VPITLGLGGVTPWNFATWQAIRGTLSLTYNIWGATAPLKFGKAKNSKIRCDLGQLSNLTANISRTGHDIDKGTQTSSRAIPATLEKKNWTSVYKQKSYKCRCWTTQVQNLARFRATSNYDRKYIWSWSTYWKLITNLIDCHLSRVEPKNFVNFGPLTNKLQTRMLTYPKSTMCILGMLLHLTLGHVTLVPSKFHPPELTPHLTTPHVGLCPIFLVCFKVKTGSRYLHNCNRVPSSKNG